MDLGPYLWTWVRGFLGYLHIFVKGVVGQDIVPSLHLAISASSRLDAFDVLTTGARDSAKSALTLLPSP